MGAGRPSRQPRPSARRPSPPAKPTPPANRTHSARPSPRRPQAPDGGRPWPRGRARDGPARSADAPWTRRHDRLDALRHGGGRAPPARRAPGRSAKAKIDRDDQRNDPTTDRLPANQPHPQRGREATVSHSRRGQDGAPPGRAACAAASPCAAPHRTGLQACPRPAPGSPGDRTRHARRARPAPRQRGTARCRRTKPCHDAGAFACAPAQRTLSRTRTLSRKRIGSPRTMPAKGARPTRDRSRRNLARQSRDPNRLRRRRRDRPRATRRSPHRRQPARRQQARRRQGGGRHGAKRRGRVFRACAWLFRRAADPAPRSGPRPTPRKQTADRRDRGLSLYLPWRRASPKAAQDALTMNVGRTLPAGRAFAKPFLPLPAQATPNKAPVLPTSFRSLAEPAAATDQGPAAPADRDHSIPLRKPPGTPRPPLSPFGQPILIFSGFFVKNRFASAPLLSISPLTERRPAKPPPTGLLGNRLTVDPRTLTPLVLVRIQVPQPIF